MSGSAIGKVMAIGGANVRRFTRDRTNLFFVFIFPVALIVVIGLQIDDEPTPRLGVAGAGGTTGAAMLDELRAEPGADIEIVRIDDPADLDNRVESRDLDAGLVLPGDLDAAVAAGEPVELGFVAGNTDAGQQLRGEVDRALARVMAETTATRAAVARGAAPDRASRAAERLAADRQPVEVRTVTTGDRLFPAGTGGYDVAAPSQLVLFVFITSLAGSSALIETRRLGLSRRMLSTPTSSRSIIAGEGLGRLLIGLVQGLYILVATLILFGLDWGDPLGAAAVLVTFAAVATGAAMCFGALFDQPEQASGIGVVVSLGLGALGGAMLPVELFSDTLASVARLTPHYWALDAFAELIRHDGSVLDIGRQLTVLAGFAAVLIVIAAWLMRRVLTRAPSP